MITKNVLKTVIKERLSDEEKYNWDINITESTDVGFTSRTLDRKKFDIVFSFSSSYLENVKENDLGELITKYLNQLNIPNKDNLWDLFFHVKRNGYTVIGAESSIEDGFESRLFLKKAPLN